MRYGGFTMHLLSCWCRLHESGKMRARPRLLSTCVSCTPDWLGWGSTSMTVGLSTHPDIHLACAHRR